MQRRSVGSISYRSRNSVDSLGTNAPFPIAPPTPQGAPAPLSDALERITSAGNDTSWLGVGASSGRDVDRCGIERSDI